MRNYWQELWFNIAEGKPSEMEKLQRMEIVEFWGYVDNWEAKLQRETDAYKQKNGG